MERPDELVSVPRWVLNELIPMSLGAIAILLRQREEGHPTALSEEAIEEAVHAIDVADEAFRGGDPIR